MPITEVSGNRGGGFGEVSRRFQGSYAEVSGRLRGGFREATRRFRGSYAEVSGNPFGPCDYEAALMHSITIANENGGEGIRRQRVEVLHGLIAEVSGKQTEAKSRGFSHSCSLVD